MYAVVNDNKGSRSILGQGQRIAYYGDCKNSEQNVTTGR